MDTFETFRQIAKDGEAEFYPICVLGIAVKGAAVAPEASIRAVADERILAILLAGPQGRDRLVGALTRLCDGLKPPDDQPKDAIFKRFVMDADGAEGGC